MPRAPGAVRPVARPAVAALLCLAASTAAPAAEPGFAHWEFEIRADGGKLGTLVFDFAQEGDERVVRRKETLAGRKLLIRFSLDQRTTERWLGPELRGFESHALSKTSLGDEEKRLRVRRGEAGALLAEVDGKSHELPAAAWPATFWNEGFMARQQVFDAKAGQLATLSAQAQGKESVPADGGQVECTRYSADLSIGKHRQSMAVWYDARGRLCALRQGSGSDAIEYARLRAE